MIGIALDVAHSEFVKHRTSLDALSPSANEAKSRLQAIDTILFDVFDWQKEDVDPEHYCRVEGYADYVCKVEGENLLVILGNDTMTIVEVNV